MRPLTKKILKKAWAYDKAVTNYVIRHSAPPMAAAGRGMLKSSWFLPAVAGGVALASTHPIHRMVSAAGEGTNGDPNSARNYLHNMGYLAGGAFVSDIANTSGGRDLLGQFVTPMSVDGVTVRGNQPGFSANVTSTGVTPGITSEGMQYSVNPDPDQQLRAMENPGGNPSGSIVFGLYNNRLK